ncbi:MAG: DUF6701 domain-containing protein [Pseudomonadales bacterium]|nr:MSHA biogenesis protein MshQ [Alphaproteobacteria bacterium]
MSRCKPLWIIGLLLMLSAKAWAASYSLPSNNFPPCTGTWSAASSTCTGRLAFAAGDRVTASSATTLRADSGITLGANVTLGTSASTVSLRTSYGAIETGNGSTIYGSINTESGAVTLNNTRLTGSVTGTGSATFNGGTISGNVQISNGLTASGTTFSAAVSTNGTARFTNGSVAGAVTASNGIADSTVFSSSVSTNLTASFTNGAVAGAVTAPNGVTANGTNLTGRISASNGTITITSGIVEGDVVGGCCKVTLTSVTATGNVSSNGDIELNSSTVNGNMTTTSRVQLSTSTVNGNVTAATWNDQTIKGTGNSKINGICTPANTTPGKLCTGEAAPDPDPAVCFRDGFEESALGSDWAVTSRGAYQFFPSIVSGRLRMTERQAYQSTGASLLRLIPGASNRVRVTFKYYGYGGNGADGIALILSDASRTPQPGGYGGSLGYAPNNSDGFAGGWIGIALDEYGNYSDPSEGRTLGPGFRPDSVVIRGSGEGRSDYRYLTGVEASSGIDVSGPTPGPGHTYRITVDNTVSGRSVVKVERDSGSGFTTLLESFDVMSDERQAPLPENLYLSITGSTGGSNNYHEIDDLEVCADKLEALEEPEIDHFQFTYGSGLTCAPLAVTLNACADAACSSLYNGPVTVQLSPINSMATYWGSQSATFTGSTTLQLRKNDGGTVRIGVASSSVATKPLSMPVCSTPNCDVVFNESGLIFDVPTLTAGKPQSDVVIQAVKKDDASQSCAPALVGNRRVKLWSNYSNPDSGSMAVVVNNTTVSTSAAAPTELIMNFDSQAKSLMTVRYDDAGRLNLNARLEGQDAGQYGTGEGYLVLAGNDSFVSVPYGIELTSDAACDAATLAGCNVYPGARAGDAFNLRARAVRWEQDEERTATNLANNATTPNFRLTAIALTPELLAPASGALGTLSATAYDHEQGSQTTVAQAVSEVGIFRIAAAPLAGAYLGETAPGGTSDLIGRFVPAYLDATANTPALQAACSFGTSGFSYQDQTMPFAISPGVKVTGRNRNGAITRNYDRGEFWRFSSDWEHAYVFSVSDAGLHDRARIVSGGSAAATEDGEDDGDGARRFTFDNETLTYSRNQWAPVASDAPFSPAFSFRVDSASLIDQDGVCHTGANASVGAACAGLAGPDFGFLSAGHEIRLGRLRLDNANGSELAALSVPMQIEHWQEGSYFAPSTDDSCSVVSGTGLSDFTGNLSNTDTTASVIGLVGGSGSIRLTAPGAGNDGSVKITVTVPDYLRYDWQGLGNSFQEPEALAAFGIYKGAAPLIFRRELYR